MKRHNYVQSYAKISNMKKKNYTIQIPLKNILKKKISAVGYWEKKKIKGIEKSTLLVLQPETPIYFTLEGNTGMICLPVNEIACLVQKAVKKIDTRLEMELCQCS